MSSLPKILVVDDDPFIVQATRRLLKKAGYTTFPAHTGQEALDLARRHHPDIILLDVNMPDLDGFEVCRRLRADPKLADIGVIIITSTYTDGDSQAAGLDIGADGYIARPISNRELIARIHAVLRLRAAEQDARLSAIKWQITFDAVSSAILLTDTEYRIVHCNRAARDIFFGQKECLLGEKCYRLIHGSERPYHACPLFKIKKKKKRETMVFEQNGRWFEVSVDPILDEAGNFIGSVHVVNDITERKWTEEALRQSEERHRLIADMMSDYIYSGLVLPDASTVTEWVSGAFERITGYSVEEVNHLPGGFTSLLIPEDLQNVLQQQPRLFERGESSVEYRIRRKDGEIRWLQDNMKFEGREEKGAFRVIGAVRDITERKLAEAKLRQSEETYRNLFHNAQVGLFRTRIEDGKILESNDQLARMFGYAGREEFIAEFATVQNYVDPGTRERMLELIRRDGFVQDFEARFYRKDRSIFWARYSARIYPEQGWIEGVAEDITRHKQVEEALRESEEQYRQLFEAESDAVFLIDNQTGRILQANSAACALYGYSLDELLSMTNSDLSAEPEQTQEVTQKTPITPEKIVLIPLRWHRKKDGTVFPVEITGRFFTYQDRPVHIAAIRDITERKQAEEAVQRLNAELEARVEERTRQLKEAQEQLVRQEKLAILGQLAGGVGHELRNPLAVISNAVYFLKLTQPEADPKVREYLDILERETRNAEKIISDLLDFARVRSVEREVLPASELARRVFERYPPPENIRLVLDLPPDLPPLWVDARQMEQVVGNLVLNAYQAMPERGELSVVGRESPVTDHSSITDCCLLITVRDNGQGILPENLPKLFEPLFTTKPHGIGLGLAVTQKLVEANGGRIEVESTPGQGTAFTLVLPATRKEQP